MKIRPLIFTAAVLAVFPSGGRADTFGSGANTFIIDFVTIGNPGNANDTGAGGGSSSANAGGVSYTYRIGMYEVTQDAINAATNLGMMNVTAGAWAGQRPAANMTWYEAAAFVNWLNTSNGYQAAYDLTWTGSAWSMTLWSGADAWQLDGGNPYRHKDAHYFLPSVDEWYKAAFHQNDGVTANYWDFATGTNTSPDGIDFNGDTAFDAVFAQGGHTPTSPNVVTNVGIASPYGTFGQLGNVGEWNESAWDGVNSNATELRVNRGAAFSNSPEHSGQFNGQSPTLQLTGLGFRVASVPEPGTTGLLVLAGGALLGLRRRRRPAAAGAGAADPGDSRRQRQGTPLARAVGG